VASLAVALTWTEDVYQPFEPDVPLETEEETTGGVWSMLTESVAPLGAEALPATSCVVK
jgi:hypothetical protein